MGRLHRLSFLSILIGPIYAQISYPDCSSGWDWVSLRYRIFRIFILLQFLILALQQDEQYLESKPVQGCRILGGLMPWWP
jgi:hypothetical protein